MLVSVCIPSYNQTRFLKKALESLCEQSFRDFEVIVSDDSTQPDVEQLVRSYAQRLPIVYHKNSKPLGSPANWNKCLELAKGDYIKFIHHDDWLAGPDSLMQFVNTCQKNANAGLVFCTSMILNVAEDTISYNRPGEPFLQALRNDPGILFNSNQIGSPTAVMFKRSDLRFDEKMKYLVDVDFYIRLLQQHNSFVFISEALIVNTSNHPGQVTSQSLNRETQLGEYSYLYNKLFQGRVPDRALSRFFISLFRHHDIKKLNDIRTFAELPRPHWYFRLLVFLGRNL